MHARVHTHIYIFIRTCSRTQVLDDSGSMTNDWKGLVQAVKSFLGVRSGIGVEDRVSVVIYNSSSRVFWDAKPLCECSREVDNLFNAFQSGGTCFSRAFDKTLEVLQSPEGSSTSLRTNSPRLRPGSAKDRATQEMKLSWPRRPVCGTACACSCC